MKIAIVGSGIAGLTVAHHLFPEHDFTVFEAGGHVGGHVRTHDVDLGGRHYAVDTGFIVFNHRTYPHFTQLLADLGVESQDSDMSFSVSCGSSGLEYNGTGLNALFAQRSNLLRPRFWGMLGDVLRFNREAPDLLKADGTEVSLGAYLERGGYGAMFRDYYIMPMGAAIWSTDPARMLDFPARFFVGFFMNHGLLSVTDRPAWRVIQGGSRSYVERLVAPFRERVQTRRPIRAVSRFHDHVSLHTDQGTERFDAVFLACHSDQALALLADPTPAEQAVLSAIPYQANDAVLHTDTRLLPKRRLAWAAWNYLMPEGPGGRVSLTYDMNILQGLDAPETLCVTLNATERIDPDKVIASMTYHHPLFTPAGVAAQLRHREIDGTRRTYYCGAWWRNGFHEDGVVSALDALRHFDEDRLHLRVRQAA
ncbi:MAG: FAD-dependent oxidoreductase [Thiobacillus sp.]|nr:FAD-dependent oxidoreductase [Thiobacillus sp.]